LVAHGRDLRDALIAGLDLRDLGIDWTIVDVAGAVFAGCELRPEAAARVRAAGAAVLAPMPELGFHPYRVTLYTNDELMSGYVPGRPETTLDARIGAACVASAGP